MSVDLTTSYLDMELAHPVVASASPLTSHIETLLELEGAGASAVVCSSLFEEQIEYEELEVHHMLETGAMQHPEAAGYFPEMQDYRTGPEDYLQLIRDAEDQLSIPVIGSLNGASEGGWIHYARLIEDSGADAIELNIYFVAAEPDTSSESVELRYLKLVEAVKGSITIPLAVKIGPYFSSMAHMAQRLEEAGADGLVLFNRFLQPDIDLDTLEVTPNLRLSTSEELRLPLRWIAILNGQVGCSLAGTSGVHTAEDALKLILAGADVTMMASALLQNGSSRIREVVDGIHAWLDEREYDSVEQARGSVSRRAIADPVAYERGNYMKALNSFSTPRDWH